MNSTQIVEPQLALAPYTRRNVLLERPHDYKIDIVKIEKIQQRAFRSHRNGLASALYRLARRCTAPLANSFNALTGIILGPGGERRYRKAELLCDSCLFLPLQLVAAIIGGSLRFLVSRGRFSNGLYVNYSLDSEAKPPEVGADERLSGVTLNIAGIFGLVGAINDVTPHEERSPYIVSQIREWGNAKTSYEQYALQQGLINEGDLKRDNLPLFICLQEAFEIDSSRIFAEGLRSDYPYVIHSIGRGALKNIGLNSGLQFHSRLPIRSYEFREFTNLRGIDILARKGALRVELDLGRAKTALVYLTHLQADGGKENQEARIAEIESIYQWMRQEQREDHANGILRHSRQLIGDLNDSNREDPNRPGEDVYAFTGIHESGEHNDLRSEGAALSRERFHQFYEEDHDLNSGKRTEGNPWFSERQQELNKNLTEPLGTCYEGVKTTRQGIHDWGGSEYYVGGQKAIPGCIVDHALLMKPSLDEMERPFLKGHAEIIRIPAAPGGCSAASDHLPLWHTLEAPKALRIEKEARRLFGIISQYFNEKRPQPWQRQADKLILDFSRLRRKLHRQATSNEAVYRKGEGLIKRADILIRDIYTPRNLS
jgi:endonuclease/exonuclease/phosphatase family metal-dependent hydrolase